MKFYEIGIVAGFMGFQSLLSGYQINDGLLIGYIYLMDYLLLSARTAMWSIQWI